MVNQMGMKDQREIGMIQESHVMQKHLIGLSKHYLIREQIEDWI